LDFTGFAESPTTL